MVLTTWQPKTIKHNTTYTRNTKEKQKKTAIANKTIYTLIWYGFYYLRSGNGVGPILTALEPTWGESDWTERVNESWVLRMVAVKVINRWTKWCDSKEEWLQWGWWNNSSGSSVLLVNTPRMLHKCGFAAHLLKHSDNITTKHALDWLLWSWSVWHDGATTCSRFMLPSTSDHLHAFLVNCIDCIHRDLLQKVVLCLV